MEQALIICDAPKGREFFEDILTKNGYEHIVVAMDGEEGKRALIEGEFDICVINAPMHNTNPIALAKDIASKNICQVILFVREEVFESTAEAVEEASAAPGKKYFLKLIEVWIIFCIFARDSVTLQNYK